ncbi:MAG TPA: PLP-dependent aspartate aminotransferase family protein [Polyangia bacterium]|nr:PLP-dependent aspartate aminotransferase family protein [Polyangia bacterium]
MKFESKCVHAGQDPEPVTGALMTPVFLNATYAQAGPGEHRGFEYSRTQNPTRFALEANLAALEGGSWGLAFASGLAASATVLHLLSAGDHVVAGDDLYGGTYRLFERVFRQLQLDFTYVDPREPARIEAALRPASKLVWVETPTNPLLKECDLAEVARICQARGVLLAVDNTFLTPYYQRPLELGADLVVHSTTKFLNGHSDVVGGAVVGRDAALRERLAFLQNAIGGVPSPLDCFLVLRGTKTLAVRMERHTANAQAVVAWLRKRPEVERVAYPGRGGMVTAFLRLDLEAVRRMLRAVKLFACAESLGGVESLIEQPALMTHASIPGPQREALGITDGLVRLSVGLEHPDDLISDLEQALRAAAG